MADDIDLNDEELGIFKRPEELEERPPREPRSAREHLQAAYPTKRVKRTLSLQIAEDAPSVDRYYPRKISFQLDAATAREIERLRVVLAEDRVLQQNGRNVQSVHDAIRYLVEQFVSQEVPDGRDRTSEPDNAEDQQKHVAGGKRHTKRSAAGHQKSGKQSSGSSRSS